MNVLLLNSCKRFQITENRRRAWETTAFSGNNNKYKRKILTNEAALFSKKIVSIYVANHYISTCFLFEVELWQTTKEMGRELKLISSWKRSDLSLEKILYCLNVSLWLIKSEENADTEKETLYSNARFSCPLPLVVYSFEHIDYLHWTIVLLIWYYSHYWKSLASDNKPRFIFIFVAELCFYMKENFISDFSWIKLSRIASMTKENMDCQKRKEHLRVLP